MNTFSSRTPPVAASVTTLVKLTQNGNFLDASQTPDFFIPQDHVQINHRALNICQVTRLPQFIHIRHIVILFFLCDHRNLRKRFNLPRFYAEKKYLLCVQTKKGAEGYVLVT